MSNRENNTQLIQITILYKHPLDIETDKKYKIWRQSK